MGWIDWILEALKDFVYWLWGMLWEVVKYLLDLIGVPELEIPEIPPAVMVYVNAADKWLPLRESWTYLAAYVTLWIVVIGVKWILKAIPGIW